MANCEKRDENHRCGKCSFYKRRILVTGGSGFIGSHVVLLLVQKYPDYYIVNLDKLDYSSSTKHLEAIKNASNYKFIQGDICEHGFMRYIFSEEKIDTVMHYAAQTHVDLSFWSSLDFTRTNVYGTHVLINTAFEAGVQRFIHVSTDEVYGGFSQVALEEGAKMNPTNPYAASKAAAECIVMSYWESFKFPVIITRSNNAYGPHQYPEKVIPKFISLLERSKKCCIYGKGDAIRNFIYASDLAAAFETILHQGEPGQVYNIGTENEICMLDLAKLLISKIKGIPPDSEAGLMEWLEFVQDRPLDDLRYPMDTTKLHSLGWSPAVSWAEGLQKTIDWYQVEDNMLRWETTDQALSTYPSASNTMRIAEDRTRTRGAENLVRSSRHRHHQHNHTVHHLHGGGGGERGGGGGGGLTE